MRYSLASLICIFIFLPNVVFGETVKSDDLVKREGASDEAVMVQLDKEYPLNQVFQALPS